MKKVLKKFNRTLSIMLAAAMVLTMVPQTAMPVLAAENEVVEEASETPEVTDVTPADEEQDPADVEETGETPENPPVDEQEDEDGEEEDDSSNDNETPVIDPAENPVEEPAEEPVEEEVVDPTTTTQDFVNVNSVGDTHTITVTADEDKVECTLPGDGTYTEEETPAEANYTFTVTAKATYQIDSVKYKVGADGDEKTITAADGTNDYSIPKSEITDNVTITVAASKITYTVTSKVTVDDTEVTDFDSNATVAFSTTATEGKVDAGASLTINASLKDAAKATHKITKVAYKVGEADEVDLTANWNGTTTISNVDGNVAVTVTITQLETYKVSFGEHTNLAKVTEIKINDAAATPEELNSETSGAWEIPVTEGSKVSFKLEPAAKFAIGEVKADETVLNPTAGVYTIESVTAATTVTVKTALDKTQVGRFTFNMAEGSDKKTATMTVAVPAGVTDNDETAGTYQAGAEEKLTRLEKILVSFEAAEGYELGEVKVNNAVVQPVAPAEGADENAPAQYEVALAVNTDTKITVATDAKGSDAAKYFGLVNNASHLTLGEVKADTTAITPVTEEGANKGKYPVAAGAKRVTFSLTTAEAYEPIVTATTKASTEGGDDTTAPVEAYDTVTASGKTTYSYMILASKLADEYTVTEKQAKKTISFTGTDNVDVSIDGRLVNTGNPIEYTQGRKLTVKVTAKENATLNKVSYTVGTGDEVKPSVAKNVSEFQVTLTDNVAVTIDATGALAALPLEDEKGALIPVKGVYSVSYDGTYKAAIGEGINKALVEPTDVKLLSGSAEVVPATGKSAVVSVKEKKIEINLRNADAAAISGKKLTLKVTVGADDAAQTFAYTLQVSKVIAATGDITVPAKANQPTDTEKKYAVKTKGELNRIHAKVDAAAVTAGYLAKDPEIVEGQLVITTGQTATPDDGVKVIVYAGEGDSAIEKEVLVKTTPLISNTTKAPKVTLKSATDISLNLSLSAKTDKDVATGGVYYKIAAEATGTKPANLEQNVTKYVVKKGDAQDYELNLAGAGKKYGEGGACSYKVTVSLVHAKTAGTEPVDAEKTVAESTAFETAANKPFATQDPAWEAGLKLKKGKTTVYTGESNVAIATPQFNKITTYSQLTDDSVSDITVGLKQNDKLAVSVKDGQIIASASAKTAVGKHTIQVIALADNTNHMVASKATIVVTVVKGINTLGVSVPTTSLYKAVNKAATLKVTPIYNNDASGKGKKLQPKTKKVKWDLVSADDTSQPFADPKVSINKKNGTVTVAKDYVIKADDTANSFKIKVSIDNDKATIGDAKEAYSEAVTITNEGLDMNRLVLVDTDDKVLAVSNESKPKTEVALEATALNGATIKVVDAAANALKAGDTYNVAAANEIAVENLTYKSSKAKDVIIEGNEITVAKANTKPVLTVTANDGSKATLGIKLNVGYDAAAGELALKISNGNTVVYDPETATATTANYKGSATNLLTAELMQKTSDSKWDAALAFTNYDIKVTGGKKVEQDGADVTITTDKEEVRIELTDKSKNPAVKKTYTLTNESFVSSGVKVKAKVIGSLRRVAKSNEQNVKLELDIPAEVAEKLSGDGKMAAAMVDVDWSKATLKNGQDLNTFANSLTTKVHEIELKDFKPATKKATVQLTFTGDVSYLQNSYALKVSVGSKTTADGKFEAKAPAVAATVKVEKTKKFTFKPTTSYTIATRDGGVAIGGKASIPADDLVLNGLSLQNANFGGKANKFMDYFEIADGKLQLKSNAQVADLLDKKNKNDLTGYLTYTAESNKTYYEYSNGTGTNTVKITVKVNDTKPVAKYTANQAEILNKATETATVDILANKAPVTVKYAMFDTSTATKTDACFDTAATLVADGKIKLTLKEVTTKRSIKATVYVIPEDSFYLGKFAEGQNATFETYKTYGAAVTITLKVVQPKTMTLAEAKTAVTAWVDEVKVADPAPAWLTNKDATDASMKQTVLDNAKSAIVGDNAADFTVAYNAKSAEDTAEDFTFNAASESAAGLVKGTLKITLKDVSEAETVAFEFTIPLRQAEVPVVTVGSIEISCTKDGSEVSSPIEVNPGDSLTFTATVKDTSGNPLTGDDAKVTWSVTGGTDANTVIDANTGVLSIGSSEAASADATLTITATSVKTGSVTQTATVTVKTATGV